MPTSQAQTNFCLHLSVPACPVVHACMLAGRQKLSGRRCKEMFQDINCWVLHALSCCADFYTPPVVSHAMARIQQLASVKGVPFGGYTQAERQRVILGQPELVEALELDPSQVCHMLVSTHRPSGDQA